MPDQGDGHGEHEVDSEALDGGLAAVFRRGPRPGESVVEALSRASGLRPRIRLKDISDLGAPGEGSGDRSHSHYTFEGEIGRGGVGVVIRGTDVDLGREVALKVLREEHKDRPRIVTRFVEEAQIEGQLQHPGIIPVYELGIGKDGRPFFAMKLVKGKTLGELLDDRASTTEDRRRFLGIFEQICQATAYAHSRGVIHRDLKPSNVMVGSFGEVQVVDWGLAKVLGKEETEEGESVRTVRTEAKGEESQMGSVMGTPSYMPPEQALGKVSEIDARSDVFSLGALLLEILTGEPPYPKEAPDVLLRAVKANLEESLERLAACEAEPAMKDLCRECLSPDRASRPADGGAVAERIGGHLAAVEERARKAEVEAAEARVRAREERKARRLTVALAASVLLAVVLGGGGYLWVESQARARSEEAGRTASLALGEARENLGKARAAQPGDPGPWEAALASAVRAEEVARTGGATAEVVDEAEALSAEIETGRDEAALAAERKAKDDAMVTKLDSIRERRGHSLEVHEMEADYRAAFREYGIDLGELTAEEAAESIRATEIAGALCTALDTWALVFSRHTPEAAEEAGRFLRIASLADDDEWRNRLRRAFREEQAAELALLASEADLVNRDVGSLTLLAELLVNAVNTDAGIDFLLRVQVLHPDDYWVNYLLCFWLTATNPPRPEEALGYVMAAQALRPKSREVHHYLGIARYRSEDFAGAIAAWRHALEIDPDDVHMWGHVNEALRRTGGLEAELEALEEEVDAGRETGLVWLRIGQAHRIQGRLGKAIAAFARAVDLEPEFVQAHKGLGYCYLTTRQWEKSRRHLERVLELEPQSGQAWRWLGGLSLNTGDLEGAIEAFRHARRIAPTFHYCHTALASAQADTGDLDGALATYEELLARFPEGPYNANLEWRLAVALRDACRGREALEIGGRGRARLERMIAAEQDEAELVNHLNLLGSLLTDVFRDFDGAIQRFTRAREIRPGEFQTLSNLAITFENQRDLDRAREVWAEMAERYPASFTGPSRLGGVLRRMGRWEEALAVFRRWEARAPGDARAVYQVGWTLLATGRLDEAREKFGRVIELDPKHAWAHQLAGFADLVSGRYEDGLRLLRRGYQLLKWTDDGRFPEDLLDRHCARLAALAKDLDAIEGGEIVPGDPEDMRLLSLLLINVGRHADAVRWAEKALRADPGLATSMVPQVAPTLWLEAMAHGAAAAGGGCVVCAAEIEEAERARFRALAIEWIEAARAQWERMLERDDSLGPQHLCAAMERWRSWPFLAVVRDEEHAAFWKVLDELEVRLRGCR